jgi:putative lipoic acid-binding regulatory protein
MDEESPFEFPTRFPIKAMGRHAPGFRERVIGLVAAHADFDTDADVRIQRSRNGNFISVTIDFTATSKEQLDAVYRALHDDADILMVF